MGYRASDRSDLRDVVVNGPFKPVSFEAGEKLVLERNLRFFMNDERGGSLPYLDRVIILFNIDQKAAYSAIDRGELDWFIVQARDLPADEEVWQKNTIE